MGFDILAEFSANESIVEGVSGRKPIFTKFENTEIDQVQHPRSEGTSGEMVPEQMAFPFWRE